MKLVEESTEDADLAKRIRFGEGMKIVSMEQEKFLRSKTLGAKTTELKMAWSDNFYCSTWIVQFNDEKNPLKFFDISFRFETTHWFQVATDDVILFANY